MDPHRVSVEIGHELRATLPYGGGKVKEEMDDIGRAGGPARSCYSRAVIHAPLLRFDYERCPRHLRHGMPEGRGAPIRIHAVSERG
jgi:hypothetical protein